MTSFAYKLGAEEAQSRLGLDSVIGAMVPEKLRNLGITSSDLTRSAVNYAVMKNLTNQENAAAAKQEGAALAASRPPPPPKGPPITDRVAASVKSKAYQQYINPHRETFNSANINAGYPGGGNYAF